MHHEHVPEINPTEQEQAFTSREAYNEYYGTNLTTHNSLLSPEQATLINERFDIQVYLGTHGKTYAADYEKVPINQHSMLPTQLEYSQVKGVVSAMEAGDVLFIENYGFTHQPKEPTIVPEEDEAADAKLTPIALVEVRLRRLLSEQSFEQVTEHLRAQYKIDAWEYAVRLADGKGIHVIMADHDAYDRAILEKQISVQDSQPDSATIQELDAAREQRARDIIKDYALEHMPPQANPQSNRKPKLVLLFGHDHEEGLAQAFEGIGLQAGFRRLESSSKEARALEQLRRLATEASVLRSKQFPEESPNRPTDRW